MLGVQLREADAAGGAEHGVGALLGRGQRHLAFEDGAFGEHELGFRLVVVVELQVLGEREEVFVAGLVLGNLAADFIKRAPIYGRGGGGSGVGFVEGSERGLRALAGGRGDGAGVVVVGGGTVGSVTGVTVTGAVGDGVGGAGAVTGSGSVAGDGGVVVGGGDGGGDVAGVTVTVTGSAVGDGGVTGSGGGVGDGGDGAGVVIGDGVVVARELCVGACFVAVAGGVGARALCS